MTGLVIGSVVPDFEKFLKMEPGNTYSHTWHGIFWFNLPLAIVLSFVFHLIVRDRLIDNLPEFLYGRLSRFKKVDWPLQFKRNFGVVCFSILVGTVSHILWDDFTHSHGKFVRVLPFLSNEVPWGDRGTPVYSVLDNLSSFFGALVIFLALLRLPASKSDHANRKRKWIYWAVLLCLSVGIMGLRLVSGLSLSSGWELLITAISAFLISFILTPLIMHYFHFPLYGRIKN